MLIRVHKGERCRKQFSGQVGEVGSRCIGIQPVEMEHAARGQFQFVEVFAVECTARALVSFHRFDQRARSFPTRVVLSVPRASTHNAEMRPTALAVQWDRVSVRAAFGTGTHAPSLSLLRLASRNAGSLNSRHVRASVRPR
jgi:hypothetical protein